MIEKYGWLFLVVGLLWVVQLILSLFQTRRFYKKYYELKKDGDASSIGMAGSNWKRKIYAVLVVNKEREIIHACKLSGFTVFANLKKVNSLKGSKIYELEENPEKLDLDKKLLEAFINSAKFIIKHDREKNLLEKPV